MPPGDVGALARALGAALADAAEGSGRSSPEARKAATEYARAWSMDTLAERYVDVYERAIESFGAGADPVTPGLARPGPGPVTGRS